MEDILVVDDDRLILDVIKCKIRSTLDTQSGLNWTPNPEVTGHSIRF